MPAYLIGAYWDPRPSTAEDGLRRIALWAGALATSGIDGLADWTLRKPRGTVAISSGQVVCPADRILTVMRDELSGAPDPRFGWSLSLLSAGGGSMPSELSVRFGITVAPARNRVVLIARLARPVPQDTLAVLMRSAVTLFDPEHAVVLDWERPDPMDERPVWERPAIAVYPG